MSSSQKSTSSNQEECLEAQSENQVVKDAQASPSGDIQSSPKSAILQYAPWEPPTEGAPEKPQGTQSSSSLGSSSEKDQGAAITEGRSPLATPSLEKEFLRDKVNLLTALLVNKYKVGMSVRKADMLTLLGEGYEAYFPEILKKLTYRMDLVFGLDLEEQSPGSESYIMVAKLGLPDDGTLSDNWHLPKNGLLMPVLSFILMNGDSVTEEKMWEFLNRLGVYDGVWHFIFGDSRKLITEDFVSLQYLKYHKVPDSNPPQHVFLWGPKAHAVTSKMQVLEHVAKITGTVPTAFPSQYAEAFQDAERRVRASVAARRGTNARVRSTFSSLSELD